MRAKPVMTSIPFGTPTVYDCVDTPDFPSGYLTLRDGSSPPLTDTLHMAYFLAARMEGVRVILSLNEETVPTSTCLPTTKWAKRYVACVKLLEIFVLLGTYVEDDEEEQYYLHTYQTYDFATEVKLWVEFDYVCDRILRSYCR